MVVACWSTKGGTGTTVVAAGLALHLARATGDAVGIDLAGDLPLTLAAPGSGEDDPGVADWAEAAPDLPADALTRLEEPVHAGLALVRRGRGPLDERAAPLLLGLLEAERRAVVVDCGRLDHSGASLAAAVAAAADRSLLVLRPCFLAVHRATRAPVRPSGIVLVDEAGRSLRRTDVESCLGAPVVAVVRHTDRVARAVDAGLLATRPPRSLLEDLSGAV